MPWLAFTILCGAFKFSRSAPILYRPLCNPQYFGSFARPYVHEYISLRMIFHHIKGSDIVQLNIPTSAADAMNCTSYFNNVALTKIIQILIIALTESIIRKTKADKACSVLNRPVTDICNLHCYRNRACCLLSEWCVVTSFYQSLQAMSSFMLFSICASYCTLSGCESKSVLVEFFYSFSFLRNLSYLIRRPGPTLRHWRKTTGAADI